MLINIVDKRAILEKMNETVKASKIGIHDEHESNSFHIMWCTEKIQEILKCICALRNSNGGELTVWFTNILSMSEANKRAKTIKQGVDHNLSNTSRTDLLYFIIPTKIVCLVRGAKNVVTMNYNMYKMVKEGLKLISPNAYTAAKIREHLFLWNKSAANQTNIDLLNHRTPGCQRPADYTSTASVSTGMNNNVSECNTVPAQLPPKESPISKFVKDEKVETDSAYSKETCRFEIMQNTSTMKESITDLIFHRENKLREHIHYFSQNLGGHVYYGISSDGIVKGVKIKDDEVTNVKKSIAAMIKGKLPHITDVDVYITSVKNKEVKDISNLYVIGICVQPPSHSGSLETSDELLRTNEERLNNEEFSCTQKVTVRRKLLHKSPESVDKDDEVKTTGNFKHKSMKDDQYCRTQKSVVRTTLLDEQNLLPYVSALANHEGGELYFRMNPEGKVCEERIEVGEEKEICRKIEKKLLNLVWARQTEEITNFFKTTFVRVNRDSLGSYYVIKITVQPWNGGVFVREPECYYIRDNNAENLPFSKWYECIKNLTMPDPGKTTFVDFKGKI